MKDTIYTFTKDGHRYSIGGNNRFEAQTDIEVRFGVKLAGAKYEEIYKHKIIRTGIVR